MAATEPTFGIQHLTVVPANFEPVDDADANPDADVDGETDQ